MNGVATPEEAHSIRALDAVTDLDNGSIEDLLRLARLMISPMYDYERALSVLGYVLSRDPENPWGIYWYAYCAVYYLIEERALLDAKAKVESWLVSHKSEPPSSEAIGALYDILHQIFNDLGFSASDKIALLEESIRFAPLWVSNRFVLAHAYLESCCCEEAMHQFETAKSYLIKADPDWDLLTYHYECEVTGRAGYYFSEMLSKISRDMDCSEIRKLFRM